ncbi:MAG: M48 family metallopeptidase [Magnetococcales bacterium]|nr:M48 family metallopeptidase [Magnetococcales bacterium]
MNYYAWIVLSALLLGYLLDVVSTHLNVGAMPKTPPAPFADLIDEQGCLRARRYAQDKARLGLVAATVDLIALLTWWWWGGFQFLDVWVRSFGYQEVTTGVIYLAILMFLGRLLSLPFSLYGTFVIEERYGFNRTTTKTYLLDLMKGLILAVLLGGPLMAGVLWFFGYTGSDAWLYCWAGTTVFLLLIQYIAPVWLMPLFNRFTPLADGALKTAVLAYADRVNFRVADIYEVDGSRRSAKANAFFTGFGKSRRIALFDTLIKNHSIPELVAVLAHEVGHQKKKHILQSLIFGLLHMGLMFYLLSIFLTDKALFEAFNMEQISIYGGLTFFSLLLTPLDLLLGPILKWISRKNEFQADRFAVETIPDRSALVEALKKLSIDTLSNLTPHPFYVILNNSHPPLIERIGAINRVK